MRGAPAAGRRPGTTPAAPPPTATPSSGSASWWSCRSRRPARATSTTCTSCARQSATPCRTPSRRRDRRGRVLREPAPSPAGVRSARVPPGRPARTPSGPRARASRCRCSRRSTRPRSARWSQRCGRRRRRPPEPGGRVRVWIDLTNSPHVVVFAPMIERMRARGWDVAVTARAFAQTFELLELHGIDHTVIGRHGGRSRAGQGARRRRPRGRHDPVRPPRALRRRARARLDRPADGVRARCGFRTRRCSTTSTRPSSTRSTAAWPHGCSCPTRSRRPACAGSAPAAAKLVRYPGLKEEYSLADVVPIRACRPRSGMDGVAVGVVLRPPADVALYHRFENPLFDEVLEHLGRRDDVRAVVLPRTPAQAERLRRLALPSVIVPDHAVDGASLVAGADLVVSAGGTMNREAVVLGTPVYTMLRGPPGRRRRAARRPGPAAAARPGLRPRARAQAGSRLRTRAARSGPAGRPRAVGTRPSLKHRRLSPMFHADPARGLQAAWSSTCG